MQVFYDYLNQIRPIINASGLEQAAGIPRNCLGKHYRWADGKPDGVKLSLDHIPNILRALCATFGQIEIAGWRIIASFEEPAIIAIKSIPGREVECDDLFEYKEKQWRELYDEFDFVHYFKSWQ